MKRFANQQLAIRRLASRRLACAAPFVVAAAVVLLVASSAWACPGCKEALAANDGEQGNLVAGYFWSILFMMSMPFVLVATFGGSMYLAVRRARAQQNALAQLSASAQQNAGAHRDAHASVAADRESVPADKTMIEV